jgi:hypothetical protein
MVVVVSRGFARSGGRLAAVVVSALLLLAGCAAPLEDPARFTGEAAACPEGVDVEREVLAVSCAGSICHSPGETPAGDLDLVSPGVVDRVAEIESPNCAGEVLAVPGDPEGSLIVRKLGDDPPCGDPMPLVGDIDPGDAACIREWIEAISPAGDE